MLREDVDAPGDASVSQPPAVGAVLTSQRLLIVSPQLRVLVAGPPVPGITSCLWLGPALLYATSDHQVTGQCQSERVPCALWHEADLMLNAARSTWMYS